MWRACGRPVIEHALGGLWQMRLSRCRGFSVLSPLKTKSGLCGGSLRRLGGSSAFSRSHFSRNCGMWISIDAVPNRRPHKWHGTCGGGFLVCEIKTFKKISRLKKDKLFDNYWGWRSQFALFGVFGACFHVKSHSVHDELSVAMWTSYHQALKKKSNHTWKTK